MNVSYFQVRTAAMLRTAQGGDLYYVDLGVQLLLVSTTTSYCTGCRWLYTYLPSSAAFSALIMSNTPQYTGAVKFPVKFSLFIVWNHQKSSCLLFRIGRARGVYAYGLYVLLAIALVATPVYELLIYVDYVLYNYISIPHSQCVDFLHPFGLFWVTCRYVCIYNNIYYAYTILKETQHTLLSIPQASRFTPKWFRNSET